MEVYKLYIIICINSFGFPYYFICSCLLYICCFVHLFLYDVRFGECCFIIRLMLHCCYITSVYCYVFLVIWVYVFSLIVDLLNLVCYIFPLFGGYFYYLLEGVCCPFFSCFFTESMIWRILYLFSCVLYVHPLFIF